MVNDKKYPTRLQCFRNSHDIAFILHSRRVSSKSTPQFSSAKVLGYEDEDQTITTTKGDYSEDTRLRGKVYIHRIDPRSADWLWARCSLQSQSGETFDVKRYSLRNSMTRLPYVVLPHVVAPSITCPTMPSPILTIQPYYVSASHQSCLS